MCVRLTLNMDFRFDVAHFAVSGTSMGVTSPWSNASRVQETLASWPTILMSSTKVCDRLSESETSSWEATNGMPWCLWFMGFAYRVDRVDTHQLQPTQVKCGINVLSWPIWIWSIRLQEFYRPMGSYSHILLKVLPFHHDVSLRPLLKRCKNIQHAGR